MVEKIGDVELYMKIILHNVLLVLMTTHYCIYLVEESEQNKWKMSHNEEKWPKNEENIVKCEDCRASEILSEKGAKKDAS